MRGGWEVSEAKVSQYIFTIKWQITSLRVRKGWMITKEILLLCSLVLFLLFT